MMITIKNATKKDCNFLLDCRNQPRSRKFSKNTKQIKIYDHTKWFDKAIASQKNKIYLAKIKNQKIGYIRILEKNNEGEVSIAILDKFQGKKLSKKMLLIAEEKSNLKIFIAKVDKRNTKSVYLFKSAGYSLKKKNKKTHIYMKKKLNLIDRIEKIRKKNNSNWMDILRIAYKFAPNETSKVMKNIYKSDSEISKIVKKLK